MSAYKKEATLTIGFFVAYVLMAHTAPWAIILGVDDSIRVFGFPLHYFMAVFLGWFGVLAVAIAWNHYADKLEDEISAETDGGGLESGTEPASDLLPQDASVAVEEKAQ